ncbi:hypothetical protein [Pseudodesulfovibrio portus]|uniref:Uncharacterized protein n=1 Tax=Pseudodesulfovibrio portus TaxID=231439 RepID=A0ABM8AN80_9BACT|nr:hypothetical protein [Pseudodesulfovibrio portus]BDQ32843.1 hypothetical protein JCM14722_03850 [Pseudodesulfovibrio portus]
MKDRRTALILIAAAVMFAVGAYMLFIKSADESPVVRGEVVRPVEQPPKAPGWVNGKKEVKPDYSSSDAAPRDATPPPVTVEEQAEEPQVVEVAEDKVVTFTFVESLADFLLYRFQPKGPQGKPETLASPMGLNKYFGRELDGFAASGDDIRTARKSILDYAFTPAMLDTLYSLYADPFMIHLVDTAMNQEREYVVGDAKERRTLTTEEVKAMLRLDSRRIERTADLFRAMGANPEITDMAARYRRSAKAVERANEQLQDAIAADGDTAKAGERLKAAILQRERNKAEIITTLKQVCHACSETELFYLSQWAYRRVVNGNEDTLKSFTKAAEILDDLAIRFTDKASQLE